ncbi:cell cycle checkpoint control protein rad9a [Kappamyces sp. JEL0829]|nr:cell cycle checkpoint control protein rad9a [Kappamyces sp. JEL0829]
MEHGQSTTGFLQLFLDHSHDRIRILTRDFTAGLIKTFDLFYQDWHWNRAIYDCAAPRASFRTGAKVLTDVLVGFPKDNLEVSLLVDVDRFEMASCAPDQGLGVGERSLKTQVGLDLGDFREWSVREPVEVVFSLRDFKKVLSWADTMDLEVHISMDGPGSPLVVECDMEDDGVKVVSVLATFASNSHGLTRLAGHGTLANELSRPGSASSLERLPSTGVNRTGRVSETWSLAQDDSDEEVLPGSPTQETRSPQDSDQPGPRARSSGFFGMLKRKREQTEVETSQDIGYSPGRQS